MLGKGAEKREMQTGLAMVQNIMQVLQKKLKTVLPYDPAILLLGIYPKEMETRYQRERGGGKCLGYGMEILWNWIVTIMQLQMW